MVLRDLLFLCTGFCSSLIVMVIALCLIGHSEKSSQVAVNDLSQVIVQPVLRKKDLHNQVPVRLSNPQEQTKPLVRSVESTIVEIKNPETVVSHNKVSSAQSVHYDPLTQLPQSIQEMEQYIDAMSQELARVLEGNENLKSLLKDLVTQEDSREEEKSAQSEIVRRAIDSEYRTNSDDFSRLLESMKNSGRPHPNDPNFARLKQEKEKELQDLLRVNDQAEGQTSAMVSAVKRITTP